MELQGLYRFAAEQNIPVLPFPLPESGSMSVMTEDGRCFVGMDSRVCDDGVLEKVHLSHELGHCATGSFYSIHTKVDSRRRHENRADKWAIRNLIPVDALDDAIASGCTELWELAERFGVTESFIRKAVCLYVHGNLATELYF
ncbi:MAG: ImmA/IrrE family metallo-endopeptidase [Oscillospiraceae bacterium]|nr:ImmA/IrrE family metallo-endopeptidase [Oscillospiraceae bacterium]